MPNSRAHASEMIAKKAMTSRAPSKPHNMATTVKKKKPSKKALQASTHSDYNIFAVSEMRDTSMPTVLDGNFHPEQLAWVRFGEAVAGHNVGST